MGSGGDFVEWLGEDMSIKVFLHLEDPSHLARVSAVSTAWRNFVIANGLFKQLCLKLLPEMRSIVDFVEVKNMIDPVRGGGSNCLKLDYLTRNHRVFSQLTRGLSPVLQNDCISEAISASSTDNFPVESIWNTLEPHDRVEQGASYWSSKGQSHTTAPETLVYKLSANLCLVTEIHIQPFQAYFQYDFPIYSSKSVRFKLGHAKFPLQIENGATVNSLSNYNSTGSEFVWTYTSPEYPMIQENCLQKFKLPEPVLCVGGILQVELLGRVQRQEMDGLYYICISHVQAVGRPLMRPFDVEIVDPAGKCALKYCPQREGSMLTNGLAKGKKGGTSRLHAFTVRLMERGIRGWENMILNRLLRIGPVDENDLDDEHLDEHPLP
ncbi:F-box protein At4g00755-like [Mercurialis annua]|uniref:F-box protein At4g00755-like n=1 Tax=Mercurialis annua TaxID=3986 RepID=UPI00215F847F|nr:F-box protein At4g00755-like [Mercurialis annua]